MPVPGGPMAFHCAGVDAQSETSRSKTSTVVLITESSKRVYGNEQRKEHKGKDRLGPSRSPGDEKEYDLEEKNAMGTALSAQSSQGALSTLSTLSTTLSAETTLTTQSIQGTQRCAQNSGKAALFPFFLLHFPLDIPPAPYYILPVLVQVIFSFWKARSLLSFLPRF